MRIAVRLSEVQKEEWLSKPASIAADIQFVSAAAHWPVIAAAVYFDLLFDGNINYAYNEKPVFVNAVTTLLTELPSNFIRINAWNGFLRREIVEIVAAHGNKTMVTEVMQRLTWKFIFSPDIKGMIVARTISTIINEAWFALEAGVSSKAEIDIAMKLGTGYPYGPFEWGEKIGLVNIYRLLQTLSNEDDRYTAAPLLIQEASGGF